MVFDSTRSHVPEPEGALAETFRGLRSGGWLAVFDGDYATSTVALSDHDPLQVCVDAMMAGSVNDRRVMRRIPALVDACGFQVRGTSSHGIRIRRRRVRADSRRPRRRRTGSPRHDRWRPFAALKAEAQRRAGTGEFFGHIAYISLLARKRLSPSA
ncbi:MAG: hypothetical protein ACRDP9_26940 [Kribbellaceae bacterium]